MPDRVTDTPGTNKPNERQRIDALFLVDLRRSHAFRCEERLERCIGEGQGLLACDRIGMPAHMAPGKTDRQRRNARIVSLTGKKSGNGGERRSPPTAQRQFSVFPIAKAVPLRLDQAAFKHQGRVAHQAAPGPDGKRLCFRCIRPAFPPSRPIERRQVAAERQANIACCIKARQRRSKREFVRAVVSRLGPFLRQGRRRSQTVLGITQFGSSCHFKHERTEGHQRFLY